MALLVLILVLFLVFAAETALYRKKMFRGIEYRCYFSTAEACEGDEVELVEEVTNSKLLPIPWFRSDFSTSRWLDFAGTRSVTTDETRYVVSFFSLGSYRKVTRRWKIICRKRGVFAVEHVQLMATDLLGACQLSQGVESVAQIMVLPRPVLPMEPEFSIKHLMGDITVRRHVADDPFLIAGIREYQESDPMNRISWLATARTGQLMVRECAYTTSPSMAVLLNIRSSDFERGRAIHPELVENAIRICAGLFQYAAERSLPLEFRCNATLPGIMGTLASIQGTGLEHAAELCRLLSQLPLFSEESFDIWLEKEAEQLDSTDIIIVTAYLTPMVLSFVLEHENAILLVTGFPEECAFPVSDFPERRLVWLGGFFRDLDGKERENTGPPDEASA